MIIAAEKLLTAEEFGELDDGLRTELVKGRVVQLNMPYPRHGEICTKVVRIVGQFVDVNDVGRITCNDSGVITERDPDTVRGADVAYYSFERVPKGPIPRGYLAVAPELVFEVRSASDRWPEILVKAAEYLDAGVKFVCVLDDQSQSAHVYTADEPVRMFTANDDLVFPLLWPAFRMPVQRFFE